MVTLRPYQAEIATRAVNALRKYGMAYVAMEPRTGKTLTALETCRLYGTPNVLFVTRLKAIPSIQKDYDAGEFPFFLQVINYESIHKVNILPETIIVCDEAHSIGAFPRPSLRAKRIRSKAFDKPVIFLSGTPTPESYSQIYHQLWVSKQSPYAGYKNFYQWARDYVNVQQARRGAYLVNDYSDACEERIRNDIAPFFMAFTQAEAGFSCSISEQFIDINDNAIPPLIRKIFRDRIINFKSGPCVADTPAAIMGKMHQISGGTVICDNGTEIISEEKARYIKENYSGKRLAIYYKFMGERTVLDKWFPDATGSAEEFQEKKSDIFLSQILSGREGLALCSADVLIIYNPDYSATSYWQSRARIQDLKRETPAIIHWLCTTGGLERHVYKAVQAKKDFTLSYFVKNKLHA